MPNKSSVPLYKSMYNQQNIEGWYGELWETSFHLSHLVCVEDFRLAALLTITDLIRCIYLTSKLTNLIVFSDIENIGRYKVKRLDLVLPL